MSCKLTRGTKYCTYGTITFKTRVETKMWFPTFATMRKSCKLNNFFLFWTQKYFRNWLREEYIRKKFLRKKQINFRETFSFQSYPNLSITGTDQRGIGMSYWKRGAWYIQNPYCLFFSACPLWRKLHTNLHIYIFCIQQYLTLNQPEQRDR
jgi:hypothetical protein